MTKQTKKKKITLEKTIVYFVLLIGLYTIFEALLYNMGYSISQVSCRTDSMYPLFCNNTSICLYLAEINPDVRNIYPGDIIVFIDSDGDSVIHRVVEICYADAYYNENGNRKYEKILYGFKTQGDNNDGDDGCISRDLVYKKFVMKLWC